MVIFLESLLFTTLVFLDLPLEKIQEEGVANTGRNILPTIRLPETEWKKKGFLCLLLQSS